MIDILVSGGPVMIPLGFLSLAALAIIIERLWILRLGNYLQSGAIQALTGLLAGRKFRAAVDYCRRHPG